MCTGIALAYSDLPLALIERHGLGKRVHDRGGEKEVRFLYRDARPVLPVRHEGQLRIVRWGTRRGQSAVLPPTCYTWLASVEAGRWAAMNAAAVEIPAGLGLENGVWFRIREGIRGLLVEDESGRPAVYVIVEPASHYYRTMTKSRRMAVLLGERI
jgi:hypothetical protein